MTETRGTIQYWIHSEGATPDNPVLSDHYYLHQELWSAAGLVRANGSLEEVFRVLSGSQLIAHSSQLSAVDDTYGDAHIYQFVPGDFS